MPFSANAITTDTESSPFQRSYTRSHGEKTLKNSTPVRNSIKNFDMSSPLRMLRRSCPQSPSAPLYQTAGHQG